MGCEKKYVLKVNMHTVFMLYVVVVLAVCMVTAPWPVW